MTMMLPTHRLLLLLIFLALYNNNHVTAQRFLRQSNNEDFAAEARLDDSEKVAGLSRELTLAGNVEWELPKLSFQDLPSRQLRNHVHKYLGRYPVRLKLLKERNKNGSLRAVGVLPNGKKLRVLWREGQPQPRTDLLSVSYEEALRSRLPPLELEVVLPPLQRNRGARQRVLPSVTYRFPMGSGAINPKTIVPRTAAQVHVWPEGRQAGEPDVPCWEVGECHVSATPLRVGMVDPSWAKGRHVFRRGRKSGLV